MQLANTHHEVTASQQTIDYILYTIPCVFREYGSRVSHEMYPRSKTFSSRAMKAAPWKSDTSNWSAPPPGQRPVKGPPPLLCRTPRLRDSHFGCFSSLCGHFLSLCLFVSVWPLCVYFDSLWSFCLFLVICLFLCPCLTITCFFLVIF